MNTTKSRTLIRFVAGPVAAAGILGGALGLAAVANASTDGTNFSPHSMAGTFLRHEQERGATQDRFEDGGNGNTQGGTQGGRE